MLKILTTVTKGSITMCLKWPLHNSFLNTNVCSKIKYVSLAHKGDLVFID